MLYSPVLCNDIAQSSPEPLLVGSSAGAPGASSSVSAPIASSWWQMCRLYGENLLKRVHTDSCAAVHSNQSSSKFN